MKPFLITALLLSSITSFAQIEIPGDSPGDEGWMVYGQDTLFLVRAEDGHVWLQQDLGSEQVAQAFDDPLAQGALYQWGRWTDGHQSRTSATALASTLSSNDPVGLAGGSPFFLIGMSPADWWSTGDASDTWSGTGATANNGIDPCAALGPDWQLPSQDDWIYILTMEGITDLSTAFASNLKLSAGGSRDGQSGTIINAGQFSNYWSSTTSGIYAKDLTIGPTFVNPNDDAYRSYGMSVRCLHRALHTNVAHNVTRSEISIGPNPTQDLLYISSERIIERIRLVDMTGHYLLDTSPMAATAIIDLSQFPEGLYFAEIRSGGIAHASKVMVVH